MEDHIDRKALNIWRIDSMQKWALVTFYKIEKEHEIKDL